jgi:EAL domain-containing protein (putative c-di-GMP-specific phosphodiesterase class I)/GGDEF domain-containing protein
MTLSRQLLLLISALFLMIFSVNFISSVNNTREYLEGEAEVHAQDTATSLGLSLSHYMAEETDPVIQTMMNAIFDMGYYQEIKLVNVENQPLVTLTNKVAVEGVPSWFIETLPMKTAGAESEISSGWNISGVVYVTLNPGYAYLKLYEQAKSSLYFSLAAFVLSIVLLHILLRVTLAPLKKIDQMALKIAGGQFETIDQLPWTTEVRNVTASMNMMSKKVEATFNNLNLKLEGIGKKLQKDDLTGLSKKSSFETEMKHMFMADADVKAYIFMIKIDGLSTLVKELGTDAIDAFIIDFAEVLTSIADNSNWGEISVYRFFGSEFVLLAKQINLQQTELLAKKLRYSFTKVGEKYKRADIAHMGVVPFNPLGTADSILLAAKEAYEQAQLIGANSYYVRTGEDPAKDIAEWKSLVFSIIDSQKYSISLVGSVEDFQSKQVLMVDAFTQVFDKKGRQLSIGTFVSIAEKFAKIVELDKGVIKKVIERIETESIAHAVAINLSARTIKNSDFRSWLAELIKQKQTISQQLVFSHSAYAVAKDISVYKEFIAFVHQLNAKVMIKRFETQSLSPDQAKELNPDFIRLARDLGQGIAVDKGKAEFVETMKDIGELLDISILAENVSSDDDYAHIKTIGIAGASR